MNKIVNMDEWKKKNKRKRFISEKKKALFSAYSSSKLWRIQGAFTGSIAFYFSWNHKILEGFMSTVPYHNQKVIDRQADLQYQNYPLALLLKKFNSANKEEIGTSPYYFKALALEIDRRLSLTSIF